MNSLGNDNILDAARHDNVDTHDAQEMAARDAETQPQIQAMSDASEQQSDVSFFANDSNTALENYTVRLLTELARRNDRRTIQTDDASQQGSLISRLSGTRGATIQSIANASVASYSNDNTRDATHTSMLQREQTVVSFLGSRPLSMRTAFIDLITEMMFINNMQDLRAKLVHNRALLIMIRFSRDRNLEKVTEFHEELVNLVGLGNFLRQNSLASNTSIDIANLDAFLLEHYFTHCHEVDSAYKEVIHRKTRSSDLAPPPERPSGGQTGTSSYQTGNHDPNGQNLSNQGGGRATNFQQSASIQPSPGFSDFFPRAEPGFFPRKPCEHVKSQVPTSICTCSSLRS